MHVAGELSQFGSSGIPLKTRVLLKDKFGRAIECSILSRCVIEQHVLVFQPTKIREVVLLVIQVFCHKNCHSQDSHTTLDSTDVLCTMAHADRLLSRSTVPTKPRSGLVYSPCQTAWAGDKCMLCRTGSYHLSRLHHSRYKLQARCPAPVSFDKTANAAVLGSPGHIDGTTTSNACLISARRPGNRRPRLRLW